MIPAPETAEPAHLPPASPEPSAQPGQRLREYWRLSGFLGKGFVIARAVQIWAMLTLLLTVVMLGIEGLEMQRAFLQGLPWGLFLALRLPELLGWILPASAAVTGGLLSHSLTRRGELVGLMSLGYAPWQLVGGAWLVVGGLSLGLSTGCSYWPQMTSTNTLARISNNVFAQTPQDLFISTTKWQASEDWIFRFQALNPNGCLEGMEALQLQGGQLHRIVQTQRLCPLPSHAPTTVFMPNHKDHPLWTVDAFNGWQLDVTGVEHLIVQHKEMVIPDAETARILTWLPPALVYPRPQAHLPVQERDLAQTAGPIFTPPQPFVPASFWSPLLMLLALSAGMLRPRQGDLFHVLARAVWPLGLCLLSFAVLRFVMLSLVMLSFALPSGHEQAASTGPLLAGFQPSDPANAGATPLAMPLTLLWLLCWTAYGVRRLFTFRS